MKKYIVEYSNNNFKHIRTALGLRSARAEALSLVYSRRGHVKIIEHDTKNLVEEFSV